MFIKFAGDGALSSPCQQSTRGGSHLFQSFYQKTLGKGRSRGDLGANSVPCNFRSQIISCQRPCFATVSVLLITQTRLNSQLRFLLKQVVSPKEENKAAGKQASSFTFVCRCRAALTLAPMTTFVCQLPAGVLITRLFLDCTLIKVETLLAVKKKLCLEMHIKV